MAESTFRGLECVAKIFKLKFLGSAEEFLADIQNELPEVELVGKKREGEFACVALSVPFKKLRHFCNFMQKYVTG